MKYKTVLTIAGSDPSGGAGIQADLKTFSALGCYGMSVITALTAQNTQGVRSIFPVSAQFVGEQLDSIFEDIGVNVVKIGMLFDADIICVVAERLRFYKAQNVVIDPVMVAKSGDSLLKKDAIAVFKERLLPLADLLTPNLPEAEVLLGALIKTEEEMEKYCRKLSGLGAKNVLLKGGHFSSSLESPDCFFDSKADQFTWMWAPRINTLNTHGTGCTLSSAIAAFLSQGDSFHGAVFKGKEYVNTAIQKGAPYELGHGHGPVHHFHSFW